MKLTWASGSVLDLRVCAGVFKSSCETIHVTGNVRERSKREGLRRGVQELGSVRERSKSEGLCWGVQELMCNYSNEVIIVHVKLTRTSGSVRASGSARERCRQSSKSARERPNRPGGPGAASVSSGLLI